HQHRPGAGGAGGLDIGADVADHDAALGRDAEPARRLADQAGRRLATRAAVLRCVRAEQPRVERADQRVGARVDRLDLGTRQQSAPDPALVADDGGGDARVAQPPQRRAPTLTAARERRAAAAVAVWRERRPAGAPARARQSLPWIASISASSALPAWAFRLIHRLVGPTGWTIVRRPRAIVHPLSTTR